MFVYWGKKEKWYRDMESFSGHCKSECNSMQVHTYRLYEQRRKHYSVISGPTKRSVRLVCEKCKTESKLEIKHEKQMVAQFTGRILIAEGYELIQQQNHGKALKKFRESIKKLDNFFKGLSSFKHTDFYTEDLQSYNELSIQASYGSAMCCITLIASGKDKTNLSEEAKAGINFLESMLPDNDEVKRLRNYYHTTLVESFPLIQRKDTGEVFDVRKIFRETDKEDEGEQESKRRTNCGAMPWGWKPEE